MAEEIKETPEAGPVTVQMTPDELMDYERRVQLGDPETTTLLNGETVAEFQKKMQLRQREEAKVSAEREDAGMRRETSAALPSSVTVTITDAGQTLAVSPPDEVVVGETPEGETVTAEPPITQTEEEVPPPAPRGKRKASEPVPASPPLPADTPAE